MTHSTSIRTLTLPMAEEKNVILTGTSSGMGEATALYLSQRGYRVFGGNLPEKEGPVGPSLSTHSLDIQKSESVARFVSEVAHPVYALINNAGFALAGAVEETSLEEGQRQLETNFYGMVRLCKEVIPHMRKQGSGRIINTSSGAAVAGGPFHAFYSASKFAVEGFTEALRHELRPFGIHVSILQPGCFRTSVVENAHASKLQIEEYTQERERCLEALQKYNREAPDPVKVARLLFHILQKRKPALRYRIGTDVTMSSLLRRFLPESWYQALVADYYKVR